MVVDTSALIALLLFEPEAESIAVALASAPVRLLSAVTRAELSFVAEGRKGDQGRRELEALLERERYDIASATPEQAFLAIEAFRRFGKGRHRAALNIGDCFSYALAKATDQPLLFKGRDFALTDIRSALPIGQA